MVNRNNKLIVEFDNDIIDKLNEWKRYCSFKNPHGGIKERIQEFIKKDLEVMKKEK